MINLTEFSQQHDLQGLSDPTLAALVVGDYSMDKSRDFLHFQYRLDNELLKHEVITHNPYTQWFSGTYLTPPQLKAFIVQFSVFSNQFLVAQLLKMLAANTLEEMRASKEILANEIGVLFSGDNKTQSSDEEGQFGNITGSIENGRFRFAAAHFELLLRTAEAIGLKFNQLGKRRFGSTETLFFCDELKRLYSSEDYQTANAASYAVENWAAAGFWDELVEGLRHFRAEQLLPKLPISFFTWHSKLEANHARHIQQELEQYYFTQQVDEDRFIVDANEMLDGVYTFWRGLAYQRRNVH